MVRLSQEKLEEVQLGHLAGRSWQPLGEQGYEAVRQVAVDKDWSELRLRRAEYIKTLRRAPERAMSATGKKRVGKGSES